MLRIVETSLTRLGTHREHSPAYHFVFLGWLDRFVEYLQMLTFLPQTPIERLRRYRDAMIEVSYYLYDHAGVIAQLGDSDHVLVSERYPQFNAPGNTDRNPVWYDDQSGYAIYKGNRLEGDPRYVVFANQHVKPEMIFHYHDDVLSVYYANDGETILGDAGKYEYSFSSERRFFISPAAHNTIFPIQYLRTRRPIYAVFLADSTKFEEDRNEVRFFGSVQHSSADVERTVRIPRSGDLIIVEDQVRWPPTIDPAAGEQRLDKPQYTAMVWNVGPDVVSFEEIDTAHEGVYEWTATTASGRRFILKLIIDQGAEGASYNVEVMKGNRLPEMGWYSPAMFVKRKIPSILITLRPQGVCRITTIVERTD
jgi:hypothetical protein